MSNDPNSDLETNFQIFRALHVISLITFTLLSFWAISILWDEVYEAIFGSNAFFQFSDVPALFPAWPAWAVSLVLWGLFKVLRNHYEDKLARGH